MLGSQYSSSAGYPVDFNGFNAIARYWRLVITKNHGALNTSFHGIEFFGYDVRISKLLNQLKLNEYEQDLVENVRTKISIRNFFFSSKNLLRNTIYKFCLGY